VTFSPLEPHGAFVEGSGRDAIIVPNGDASVEAAMARRSIQHAALRSRHGRR
jgi:hypothetical protein